MEEKETVSDKRSYTKPEIIVIPLDESDVITTSGNLDDEQDIITPWDCQ